MLELVYNYVCMGKRGPKAKQIISEVWSRNLAYAIGLLATDGCISRYGHQVDLTSNDIEQLENYKTCLNIKYPIGKKRNDKGQKSFRVQFKNVFFYQFLVKVGLTPAKSKTLGPLKVPGIYFFDFLRGSLDGDGCTYSYWDPRWKSSFMFYTSFTSASKDHIDWIQKEIKKRLNIIGHISVTKERNFYQLRYAKKDSLKLLPKIYYSRDILYLSRKRLKINEALGIIGKKI